MVEHKPGFDIQHMIQVWSFNLISRGIGAIVRVSLIIVCLVLLLVAFFGGAAGLLFWFFIPLLSYTLYKKYIKQPRYIVSSILEKLETSQNNPIEAIFSNEAGSFVLKHLELDKKELEENANLNGLSFTNAPITTYSDLLTYLFDHDVWEVDFFHKHGLTNEDVKNTASWWDKRAMEESQFGDNPLGRPSLARELTFGFTPSLDKYTHDLSITQSFSHHLIGRQQIVNRIERELLSGQNVFLTGDPGVGRKTVILEFAHKAATGMLRANMSFKRILEFDYNELLAESVDLNQKKTELNQILTEASYAGNVILMIRDLHRLVNQEVEGVDFTDVFENILEKRNLRIIAVSSNIDYERYLAPNIRIRKFFERVQVVEPSKAEALKILEEVADQWEARMNLTISYKALKQILETSDQYITETPFPEKVIEILDAVVTFVNQNGKAAIDVSDVNAVLAEKTGISFASLSDTEKGNLQNLEDLIHKRLVNQNAAVSLIAKILRSKTVGVIKENRPIGSFLFLGPTGVGKTETAKVLARVYYGREEEIIRFDMAEFVGIEGIERLTGSSSRNMPGVLTTSLKNKPASLLLLDEIEKASPPVFNLFLTLLDEGYITDAFGKKINCKNVFVIGTSNAGAEYIRQLVQGEEPKEEMQSKVIDHILKEGIFSPEFINRFDGVVVYEPLSSEHLHDIASIMLNDLKNNLESKNIHLSVNISAVYKLANDGYDPAFGARPMRRIVNLEIGDMLGRAILSGQINEGDTIELSGDNEFTWTKV